jgi:putative Mg2+ transporter-C (MgtC) family protein
MDSFFTGGEEMHLPFAAIASRLVLAATLGGLIGFEREWRQRPAGLRTHMLVCLASALFAVLTVEIVHMDSFSGEGMRYDPVRLIEAVTAGVAFLAAGVIIFARGQLQGLTTGAGMWLAAAVGLASGLGYWQIATLSCALALIVLGLLQQVEARFGFGRSNKTAIEKRGEQSSDEG